MTINRRLKIALVLGSVAALAGTAFAFSIIFTHQGTIASYDFGSFGPGYPVPGTVEVQAFTMRPGDVVPWHYHKGLAYAVIVSGSLTEQELIGENTCGPVNQFEAGAAFVETPGRVHTVSNPGPGSTVIYWSTVFPKSDGPYGDAVFVTPPNCN
jgi:quercetin dioxygenase-like cupin family protein